MEEETSCTGKTRPNFNPRDDKGGGETMLNERAMGEFSLAKTNTFRRARPNKQTRRVVGRGDATVLVL